MAIIINNHYTKRFVISLNPVAYSPGYAYGNVMWQQPYEAESWYLGFVYFWNLEFFVCAPQFAIASACVCWYFKKATDEKLGHPVAYYELIMQPIHS